MLASALKSPDFIHMGSHLNFIIQYFFFLVLREISGANEPQSRLGPQGQSSKMGAWFLPLINNPGTAEYGFRSLMIKVQILALPLLDCVPWASPFILRMYSFLI